MVNGWRTRCRHWVSGLISTVRHAGLTPRRPVGAERLSRHPLAFTVLFYALRCFSLICTRLFEASGWVLAFLVSRGVRRLAAFRLTSTRPSQTTAWVLMRTGGWRVLRLAARVVWHEAAWMLDEVRSRGDEEKGYVWMSGGKALQRESTG